MTLTLFILAGAIVALLALIFVPNPLGAWLKLRLKPSKKASPTYVLNATVLTPAEKSFLDSLDSLLSPEIRVFAKIRLADLFTVAEVGDRGARTTAFNRIRSKHLDFLLVRSDDFSPLVAIELDDSSHNKKTRQERDRFLNALFTDSPIRLLRFKVEQNYDLKDLAQKLTEALEAESSPGP